MGSTFHLLCPRYSGSLTPTAPTAVRLWDFFTFTLNICNCIIHVPFILCLCIVLVFCVCQCIILVLCVSELNIAGVL